MTKTFIYQRTGLAAACALALPLLSGPASAQLVPAHEGTYLQDTRGASVMSGHGECWHTGTGPQPIRSVECGATPAPVAKLVRPAPPPAARVAPAQAPAPMAAHTPPPTPTPVAVKLTLDADTLFDFDKSVLRQEGRDALDVFIGKLKGISAETIMAVGHTDRLGSERYNQRLSEQRVEAVKTYLVASGIAPNRVSTTGRGEMQPVTKPGECEGGTSAKVIACLQPDRRVEIETIGTQINR